MTKQQKVSDLNQKKVQKSIPIYVHIWYTYIPIQRNICQLVMCALECSLLQVHTHINVYDDDDDDDDDKDKIKEIVFSYYNWGFIFVHR